MESGASLATRNPRPLASPRVKVGLGTVRFPGFQRRMRGARLVATGAFGRRSVPVESKLSCELGEAGVGAIACGDHWRRNALERIHGFGDFGVTTVAMRAIFKKKFSEGLIRKDHEDGDDEEEEGGYRDGKSSDDDDTEDTTDLIRKDHEDGDDEEEEGGYRGGKNSDDDDTEDTTDDEEDTSTDEEDTSSDEEDTTEDEDEDDDERECDD